MENIVEELRKIPPQQIEAEQSLLGGILIDNEVLPAALEILRGDEFYRDAHRTIFSAIQDLFERNEPIDLVTLVDLLSEQNKLESVGGATYLASLVEMVPTSTNVAAYAKIVSEKAILRRLIQGANEVLSWCYERGKGMEEILDHAEKVIFSITENRLRTSYFSIQDIVKHSVKAIEEFQSSRKMITGVPSGYTDLDKLTAGFQPSDLIIIAARPSMGKCLSFDSEIVLKNGHVTTIEEIHRQCHADLLTLNRNWKFGFTQPSTFVDDGVKPVYRVTTRLGRCVESTLPHPFLTIRGWRRLEELKPGDKIAVPRKIDVFGTETLSDHKIKLLAYLIGDGCLTKGAPEFTNRNPVLRKEFSRCVEQFAGLRVSLWDSDHTRTPSLRVAGDPEFITAHRKLFGNRLQTEIRSQSLSYNKLARTLGISPALVPLWTKGCRVPNQKTFTRLSAFLKIEPEELTPHGLPAISKNGKNSLTLWLQEVGLWGKNAHAKIIPPIVFRLTRPQIALFLNRLFATDGWATLLASGQSQLGYSSVSEKLVRQVQHLLLRFGVIATLKKRFVKYKDSRRQAWQLDITEPGSVKTFISEIGIFGKEEVLSRIEEKLAQRQAHVNRDLIPIEIWQQIAQVKGVESWASLARRAGIRGHTNIHVGTRSPSRQRLSALAAALNHSALQEVAESDVYWDEIVSIEAVGHKQVYDLTIPETHNFVANDICVHNTALALCIARNVALEYGAGSGFFSLEMSKEQLAMRLLCAEGRVDSQKIRTGFLDTKECAKLVTSAGYFMDAPIYIDDTPAITTMELRAKARRMMMERGIRLIIVDYLQLMRSHRGTDQREQEISEISRSLKALAKELNVPVIALSQLNRKVEERNDKRPQLSDLRESGCLTGDSLITLADSGVNVPIRNLAGQTGFAVWTLNESNMKIERAIVSRAFPTGIKSVYRLTTQLGRSVRATDNHKFLTIHGWKCLHELNAGERIALPPRISEDTGEQITRTSESDVYWDKIASIEADGEEKVFDLTVPKTHNFIANDIVVHNSIEQDADVVAFVYREEMYRPDTQDKGIAEILIRKQRNGPTGTVKLAYIDSYTRFENLAR